MQSPGTSIFFMTQPLALPFNVMHHCLTCGFQEKVNGFSLRSSRQVRQAPYSSSPSCHCCVFVVVWGGGGGWSHVISHQLSILTSALICISKLLAR